MMSGVSSMGGMMNGMRQGPQQMFNRMDKDGSAGIDKDELNAMAEKVAERTGNEIDVESLMEEYDGDGDGLLNQEETQSAMESIKDQMGPPDGKPMGSPPGGGGRGGGEKPGQEGPGVYGQDGVSDPSLVSELLESLSEAADEEDQEQIVQEWVQALKGENQSYSPIDTRV